LYKSISHLQTLAWLQVGYFVKDQDGSRRLSTSKFTFQVQERANDVIAP